MAKEEMILEITELLEDLKEDDSITSNIRVKLNSAISLMKKEMDISVKTNKVLQELEDIMEESNLDTSIRTELWNISSMLETI